VLVRAPGRQGGAAIFARQAKRGKAMFDGREPLRSGPETASRPVISPEVVALTVRQAEARRLAMIAKWDHNGWLVERAASPVCPVGPGGARDCVGDQERQPTAA
jgi:hypothetical protein